MEFVALKELPQGQQPGELFETTEEMGDVLILVGGARKATDDDRKTGRRAGGYRRRDMKAESS